MIGVRRFLTAWEDRQSLLAGVNSLRCELVEKEEVIREQGALIVRLERSNRELRALLAQPSYALNREDES